MDDHLWALGEEDVDRPEVVEVGADRLDGKRRLGLRRGRDVEERQLVDRLPAERSVTRQPCGQLRPIMPAAPVTRIRTRGQ